MKSPVLMGFEKPASGCVQSCPGLSSFPFSQRWAIQTSEGGIPMEAVQAVGLVPGQPGPDYDLEAPGLGLSLRFSHE
jgi:hypothetical protein